MIVTEGVKVLSPKAESKRKAGLAELLASAMIELNSGDEREEPIGISWKADVVDRYFGL